MGRRMRRSVTTVVALCFVLAAMAWTGLADVRIVEVVDGERNEILYKNNRMASSMDSEMSSILMCETGELIMMAPEGSGGRYWVGSYEMFTETFKGLMGSGDDANGGGMDDMGGLGGFLGALFGGESEDLSQLQVRVSRAGQTTVAGYAADHYVVETSTGSGWRVREELWVSDSLMEELASDIGACVDHITGLQDGLTGSQGFGMDEMFRVMESPEYKKLSEKGYPVRSRSSYPGLFGMSMDSEMELVEVSRETLSEDHFTVPANYREVDTFFDLIMP